MYAVASLLFSPGYLPGALVLGSRLRSSRLHGATTVLLVEKSHFSHHQLQLLASVWDVLEDVKSIQKAGADMSHSAFPLWHAGHARTFTKIRLWTLNYDKVLYLDCDTLPRTFSSGDPYSATSVSDLLALDIPPHAVAAAPDHANPDTFNTGVMVLRPNKDLYAELERSLISASSYDGGDQGFLNAFFNPHPDWLAGSLASWTFSQPNVSPQRPESSRWVPLPYVYNTASIDNASHPSSSSASYATDFYSFAAAEHLASDVRCVHFVGPQKPWDGGRSRYDSEWWAAWWNFSKGVTPEALLHPPGQISIKKLQVPTAEEPHPEPVIATLSSEGWTEHIEYQQDTDYAPPQYENKGPTAPLTPSDLCDPLKYIDAFGPTQEDSTWDATREEPPHQAPVVPSFAEEIQMFRSQWDEHRDSEEENYDEPFEPPSQPSEPEANGESIEPAPSDTSVPSLEPRDEAVVQVNSFSHMTEAPAAEGALGIFHQSVAERVFDDRSNYTPQHSLLLREQSRSEETEETVEDVKTDLAEEAEIEDDIKKESEEMEKDKALGNISGDADEEPSMREVNLAPLFPWETRPTRAAERTFD